jgi:type II restriction enzyme
MKLQNLNIGEWSECYVFLKLLADPLLPTCDENLTPLDHSYETVREIIITDTSGTKLPFRPLSKYICAPNSDNKQEITAAEIKRELPSIINELSSKHNSKGAFPIPRIQRLYGLLGIPNMSRNSRSKIDIELVLASSGAPKPPEGYSIKSQLGRPAHLLNASQSTNLGFRISGPVEKVLNQLNAKSVRYQTLLEALVEDFGEIKFEKIHSETFYENLRDCDEGFPSFFASLVLAKYMSKSKVPISDLVHKTSTSRELSRREMQMKRLLRSAALGMVPSKRWDGKLQGYGGYLIVTKQGEILRLPMENLDSFESYLFKNTYFDTPAKKKWIKPDASGSATIIYLNASIRFLK